MSHSSIRPWLRRGGISPRSIGLSIGIALISSLMSFGLVVGSSVLLAKAAGVHSLVVLAGLLIAIELVAFLRAPVRFEERIASHRRAVFATVKLRLWLFDEIARRIPGSLSTVASGQLLDATIEDLESIEGLQVSSIGPLLSAATSVSIAIVAVAFLDPIAGLMCATGAVLLLVVIGSSLLPLSQLARVQASARSQSATATSDLFGGLVELTMAGMDRVVMETIEAAEQRRSQAAQRSTKILAAVTTSAGVIIAAVTGFTMRHLGSHHAPHAVRNVAIILFVLAGLEAMLAALPAMVSWASVSVAASRLSLITAAPVMQAWGEAGKTWPAGPHALVIENLCLAADAQGPEILHEASFSLAPNSLTVLRGPSGSGKSTLAAALMGLIDLTGGSIHFGEVDLATVAPAIRWQHMSVVDQHPVLFGTTLADALRMAKANATDADLVHVLRASGLDGFADVAKLDMPVGEGGATFSGGELRRIAIARALLREPAILILDEPTVGLDAEQATNLLATITHCRETTTVLIITHEPELAIAADQTLWLDDGVVSQLNG